VIVRNPEGAAHGQKGKVWELVRQNFAEAAGLGARPPSLQAIKRRIAVLVKAKRAQLQIYKSGNEEDYEEVDRLLEEYIALEGEHQVQRRALRFLVIFRLRSSLLEGC
jgi:hypothetical protein